MLAAAFERWRSFVPSSAVVGHKTQTRLGGPSVHLCSGRAAERAVSDNASGPVPPHRPPLRPVGASLSSIVNSTQLNLTKAGSSIVIINSMVYLWFTNSINVGLKLDHR